MQQEAAARGATAESEWVESELIRSLMRTARNTQPVGLVLIGIFLAVLEDDAATHWLVAWGACAAVVAAARFWVVRRYFRHVVDCPPGEQVAFFHQVRAIWPASAFVWGLTTTLFFDRAPVAD